MPPRVSKFSNCISLREPDSGVELFGVLNMAVLFCVFFLLNSRFVLSPGMEISLPVGGELQSIGTTGVITVQSEKFIMFDGNIFSLDTLEWGIKKYLQGKNCGESRENVVLVRPDKSLSVEILIKICEIARKSGYSAVQIASSPFVVR